MIQLSEAASRVIDLARKVREYYAAEYPKYHKKYPVVDLLEPGPPPPDEERQLKDFLISLPVEMIYRLILLMYLGRGDFPAGELQAALEYLKSTFPKPEWAVSQMMEKAPLADYLSDGLDELRKKAIDVDHLPVT